MTLLALPLQLSLPTVAGAGLAALAPATTRSPPAKRTGTIKTRAKRRALTGNPLAQYNTNLLVVF